MGCGVEGVLAARTSRSLPCKPPWKRPHRQAVQLVICYVTAGSMLAGHDTHNHKLCILTHMPIKASVIAGVVFTGADHAILCLLFSNKTFTSMVITSTAFQSRVHARQF